MTDQAPPHTWDPSTLAPPPINQQPSADLGITYILWLFGGLLGLHRYYLGSRGAAIAMTLLTIFVIGLPVTVVWWIVDLFLIDSLFKETTRGTPQAAQPQ